MDFWDIEFILEMSMTVERLKALYEKVKSFDPSMIIADAGYRTPAIAEGCY